MTKLDQKRINQVIRSYIDEALDEEEEVRLNLRRPYTDEEIDYRYTFLGSLKAETREALAKCDYRPAHSEANNYIETNRLTLQTGSEDYNRLCRGLLKAKIAFLHLEQKRVYGDYSNDDAIFDELGIGTISHHTGASLSEQSSDTIEQAVKDFWNENSHNWKPRSRGDYQSVTDQIITQLGSDIQLHTIDYAKLKDYRDGLRSGELTKSKKPMSIARVNFFMGTLKRIFELAMRKDKKLDRVNPAEGLQLRDKRKSSEKQDVFATEDLKLIFCESKEYGQDKHTKAPNFWLPILGLYTGARLEELCQFLVEDVTHRDGIWCLDMREDNAKASQSRQVNVGSYHCIHFL